jgi:hypothetical protein
MLRLNLKKNENSLDFATQDFAPNGICIGYFSPHGNPGWRLPNDHNAGVTG